MICDDKAEQDITLPLFESESPAEPATEALLSESTKKNGGKKDSFNLLINLFGVFFYKSINIIGLPILTSLLTPAEYGNIIIYTTWLGIVGSFLGLQLSNAISIARVNYTKEKYEAFVSNIAILSTLSFLMIFFVMTCLCRPLSKLLEFDPILIILMAPYCFGVYCVSFITAKLLSEKRAVHNLIFNTVTAIFTFVSAIGFMLIFNQKKDFGYILGSAIFNILVLLFFLIIFIRKADKKSFKEHWKFALKLTLPYIPHVLVGLVLVQSNRLILKYLIDESAAGVYALNANISNILFTLWVAINSAFVPFFFDYLKEGRRELLVLKIRRFNVLFTAMAACFMLINQEVAMILSAEEFSAGIYIIPLLIMAHYLNHLYGFAINYEAYHKKTFMIAAASAIAAVVNIILNFILIPIFADLGAALATVIAYLFLFLAHDFAARRIIKNFPVKTSEFIPGIIFISVIFVATILLDKYLFIRIGIVLLLGGLYLMKIIKQKSIL